MKINIVSLLKDILEALRALICALRGRADPHSNSLTIPYRQLAGFLGSNALARECAAALRPVRKAAKSTLFDRGEVVLWYERNVASKRPSK